MIKHNQLKVQLQAAKDLVQSRKDIYFKHKNVLTEMETSLIDAKIAFDRAQEALESYEVEYIIEHSLDVEKDIEVAAFKERLPALLERIKDEPMLALLTLSDLDNANPKRYK
jgi:hypothetical protein